jgi:F-type H+-transporting ATPase subunit delta
MRGSAATRRYARALFSLAGEEGRVAEVRGELTGFAELFDQSQELREALLTPMRPAAQRRGVLEAMAGRLNSSPTVRRFFSFLVDRRRLVEFPAIRAEYERLCEEASGRAVAEVIAARPLDAAQQERLRSALARRTGRDVALDVRLDPSLIAGAIARVGGMVFDGSLRSQLALLRANLTKGS